MSYQTYDYSTYQYPTAPGYPPPYNAYYIPPPVVEPQPQAPPPPPPPALQIRTVNASVASQSVRRILSSECRNAGFKRCESAALEKLECGVVSFVEQLYRHAKEFATLSNRVNPSPYDLLAACEDRGYTVAQLRKASKKKKRKRATAPQTRLVTPPLREQSPEILPSDDEDTPQPILSATLPQTLQDLPDHLPSLPPKHTYLRTAPAAPKRSKLPSLDKRLDNAAKVQQSLRNLVKATEDTTGKSDLELSGGIVNWMASTVSTGRKKWKV